MKLYRDRIDVEPPRGKPHRLRWRSSTYNVQEVADFWISQGKWWSAEEKRIYLRLLTDRGMMEVYRSGVEWMMSRMMD